jgi:hypothetical protein
MKNLIFLFVLIGIIVLLLNHSKESKNNLMTKGVWGVGVIKGTRLIRNIRLVYIFNDKEYVTGSTILSDSDILALKNKPLPILYLKEDEDSNELLFLKKDFADFKKPYPDSLKWICDSLYICK